jgi:hypothetical protein
MISIFIKYIFVNDIANTLLKLASKYKISSQIRTFTIYDCLPFIMLLFNFYFFSGIVIETYRKSFKFSVLLLNLLQFLRTITIVYNRSYVNFFMWLFEPIFLINIILIILTDPQVNTEERPNAITFYEIFFRNFEFNVLIVAFSFAYNDRIIEQDIIDQQKTIYTTVGKVDSYRFTIIMLVFHYAFILINGLAYSFKY